MRTASAKSCVSPDKAGVDEVITSLSTGVTRFLVAVGGVVPSFLGCGVVVVEEKGDFVPSLIRGVVRVLVAMRSGDLVSGVVQVVVIVGGVIPSLVCRIVGVLVLVLVVVMDGVATSLVCGVEGDLITGVAGSRCKETRAVFLQVGVSLSCRMSGGVFSLSFEGEKDFLFCK